MKKSVSKEIQCETLHRIQRAKKDGQWVLLTSKDGRDLPFLAVEAFPLPESSDLIRARICLRPSYSLQLSSCINHHYLRR